jgi:hypothetical protein
VEDTQSVAMFNGIQYLQENALGQFILTHILTSFCNIEEQVTLWAIFEDNINAIRIIHYLVHRHNVRVRRCEIVEAEFPVLESNLSAVQWGAISVELAERLDGVPDSSVDVDSQVHHAVCAGADYPYQLEALP